jgi:TetR/AcrR family transcriptional regulator, ethionamide resistance regulator
MPKGSGRAPEDFLAGSALAGDRLELTATELEILNATERLLTRLTFRDVNISLICTEAGVSRPTFYHYFPTKYAVIYELLAVVVKQMVAAMMPFLDRDADTTPSEAFRASFELATDTWIEHRLVLRAVSAHFTEEPELHEAWSRIWNRFIVITADFIDREREAGNAPPGADSHLLAATILWGAERALFVAGLSTNDELPGEKALVEGLVTVWHSVIYGAPADPPARGS